MIVVYPLLLVAAFFVVASRDRPGGRGWVWFGAWVVAGALFTFSFLTGLSIGLLILPAAAAALLAVAALAPHAAESVGFAAGAGATALVVAATSWGEEQPAVEPIPWLVAGLAVAGAAAAVYAAAVRRRPTHRVRRG